MKHRELESKKPNYFHSFCSFFSNSRSLTLPPPFHKSLRNLFSGEENLFLGCFFFLLFGDTWHYYWCYQHLLPRSISMPLTFRLSATCPASLSLTALVKVHELQHRCLSLQKYPQQRTLQLQTHSQNCRMIQSSLGMQQRNSKYCLLFQKPYNASAIISYLPQINGSSNLHPILVCIRCW